MRQREICFNLFDLQLTQVESTETQSQGEGHSLSLLRRGDSREVVAKLTKAPLRIYKAAFQLASGDSVEMVAHRYKVSHQAVRRWMRTHPTVFSRANERIATETLNNGLMLKHQRVRKLEKHFGRIEKLADAAEYVTKRVVGSGDDAVVFDELNKDLAKEYRASLEQLAKESGGAYEREAPAANPTNVGVNVVLNFPTLTPEQLAANEADTAVIDLPVVQRRIGRP